MARQLRIEFCGAFYHVTSRGNLKEKIFFADSDREKFLKIIKRTKDRYSYFLHAYALMNNHYHLLIETPLPNLSQIMQNINTSYTVYINKKYTRAGHLFQGRFKAIVVDKDSYLLQLSRYIHLNPVRSGMVRNPIDFRWTSYQEFINEAEDGMIKIEDTLNHFSNKRESARRRYREFVEGDQPDNNWLQDVRGTVVLGGEKFFKKVKSIFDEKGKDDELPFLKVLFKKEAPVERIVGVLTERYGNGILCNNKKKGNIKRDMGIYLIKNLSGKKNVEIGRVFGIKGAAVSLSLKRAEDKVENSIEIRRELENLKERCLSPENN
jgi:REP element-mobilizing transposase RayT